MALHGVLERADPALVDPGVTAQMERLLDDVLVGRQDMMSAIDAVCDQASRIIGRLTTQGASGAIPAALATSVAPVRSQHGSFARSAGSSQSTAPSPRGRRKAALGHDAAAPATAGAGAKRRRSSRPSAADTTKLSTSRGQTAPKGGSLKMAKSQNAVSGKQSSGSTPSGGGDVSSEDTPLRIPFGNKEAAQALGARYRTGGWYAPVNVRLTAFRERGWL